MATNDFWDEGINPPVPTSMSIQNETRKPPAGGVQTTEE